MDDNLIPLILGMAAVTYGPRLLPFLLLGNTQIPRPVNAFLKCIPVAAIGALIIPGVMTATPDMPAAALLGMGFTAVYGFFRGGIIVPVLGSVGIAYLTLAGLG
ncbi:MAG: AzlD domain-containing protein [Proteobacteria bacterium]|nr:AzlD domain-containing protein [Pseudomonadota bacterium]